MAERMRWFSGFLPRYQRNIHFTVAVLIAAILVFDGRVVNGYVSQAALAVLYQPFVKVRHLFEELYAVNEENQRLHQALVETSLRLSEVEEMKRENIRLRSVLGFEPPPPYELLPARVVSLIGEQRPSSAVINKGHKDSVITNQAVINQDGLIGKIVSVTPGFATVQLLTDPKNRVAVRIAESRGMGIVRYRLGSGMVLENFPIQGTAKVGDLILSSGLGGIYPPGLVVGTVNSVQRPPDEPFCRITVTPAVSFNSLEELFILKTVAP